MRPFERGFGEQNAVVGEDADGNAADTSKAGDERGAVERLELVELGTVDEPRDDGADIEGLARIGGHEAVELARIACRIARGMQRYIDTRPGIEMRHGAPANPERIDVIGGVVVGDTGAAGVNFGAAELLRADDLAGRRLHQRRPAEEDGALVAHDDGLVRHRRHIGAARGA